MMAPDGLYIFRLHGLVLGLAFSLIVLIPSLR